ncbi:isocitrate lyase/PEP mutase family protein [Flavimaricola marinus]|uniref:Carboxyvinyl-carboxyphosphonate phosphorylmutase n=1 Tax=Flavimaricola marinus TaxID=1819565 RepID=A0A238LES2_9RHOB|nr:isocitrate lyase/phosphoenolpyruvate mutase family protein [Flavimaricola marinus]SMY07456.1 Carboxyvinyl-carboxyphosphonate phosphorylmutase [Flavimaricola marinus]
MTAQGKFDAFQALHDGPGFLIPNAWDAGSARILADLGFEALATTSAGYAFATGYRDSAAVLTRAGVIENARAIAEATTLPISADLEAGFGPRLEDVHETITQAIAAGVVGGSIEDATGDPTRPLFSTNEAVERIEAAAEAARGRPFLLTGRAENFITGNPDLGDTIDRLQRYSAAGADVLYAPGLPDLDAIRTVCAEVDKPVNVLTGLQGATYTADAIFEAGATRISTGGSLARAALGALIRAATEIRDHGTFGYARDAAPDRQISSLMRGRLPNDESA